MPKFQHEHYDGKHWIKGTAEAALDNELNRLNKQIMKFAKANAMNSPSYKQLVTEVAKLSHNQIKYVNGVPQAKRGAKEIAKATELNGDNQYRKIAKSKSHKTFESYKKASKKLGLTPNEFSFMSNESALYYQAMYADDNDDESPLDIPPDDGVKRRTTKDDINELRKMHNLYDRQNPHTFDNSQREIYEDDIIIPVEGGHVNVETGEFFDNYDNALRSYDETVNKIASGEWSYTHGHFGKNIDWDYYNQFKRKKEW